MFAKVSVKGDDASPLYKQLAAQPSPIGGAPRWNFTKFVVDREGRVVFRRDAGMLSRKSLESDLVEKVEALLKT
jgi:glutathione peroxidase-family protein